MTIQITGHVEKLQRYGGDVIAEIYCAAHQTAPPHQISVRVPKELLPNYLPGTTVNITIYYTATVLSPVENPPLVIYAA